MDNEVKKLYSALIGKGYTTRDLGDEQTFMGKMQDADNRKQLYDWVNARGDFRIGSYDDYEKRLTAPPAPKAEEINPTSDKSGYTLTAEELVLPDNTFRSESTSVAKLPEIKPLGAPRVSMGAEEVANVQPLTTFGEGVKQGAESMYEGGRYAIGEIGRIYGDSKRVYADALEYLDKQGDDFDASSFNKTQAMKDERNERFQLAMEDYRKEMAKRRKERENLGFFATIAHKWNDPERPDSRDYIGSHYEDMRAGKAINAVDEALKEANGDVVKAREILENKAKAESWGDRVTREAGEALSQMKPVEGAAWWGQMVPQVTGQAAAIGANFIPVVGKPLSRALAFASTTALTASSAGSAMQEARAAGATDEEIMSAGALQAGIEYFSEKIPLERLLGKMGSTAFRKGFKGETGNIVREEVERLLEEGNKRLGGKLLSGQTAKEFVKNVGVEAASEFVAEGAGTFVPMIYEDKENYPTLSEAFENAIEGAKAGAVMGGFLGGGTQLLTNRANNARRKMQGNVMLAETKDGVVEVLQTNNGNAEVLNADGEVSWIPASELVKRYTYTYNEWQNNEVDTRINQAYQEGYEAADEQKGAVKQAYDMERERVLNTFGEEVVQRLDDDPVGALMELHEIDRQEAIDYVNARTAYEGMIDRISDDIDERVKASDKEIDSHKNRQDGAIHPAMMRGENGAEPKKVYIVGGNVATREDGTIDKANSSSMIIVRDAETGEVSAASVDDIEGLDAVIDTEAEKKNVAEQIANEYAGQQAAIIEGESGKLTYNSNDGVHTVEILGENGDVFTILDNGVERFATRAWVDELKAQNGVVSPVEDQIGDNTGKVVESSLTGEAAAPVVDKKARRTELEKMIPVKGKKKQFTEVEPVVTAEYIQLLTEDVDKQMATADKYIANIKAAQEKADPIEALEMDEQITYWESVKALLQGGQPTAETVPVVEETQAPVVESAPVAEVETPQATNEMQEADLTEDVKTEDVNQSENNLEMVAEGSAPGDDALSPAFATQERKGGTITLHTKTETKKGVKTTRVVAMRNGSEVSMPTAAFPVPEGMTLTDIPEGVEVTGVKELQEGNDGKTAATVFVKYEDGGLDTMETRVVKPAGETTVSQTSDQVSDQEKQSTQSVGEQVQAAEAEVNTTPTDAQKEAGNYKKGHVKIGPFNISIEQPKGSVRSGVDKDGKKWEVEMQNTYGYFRGTEGVDGDHIDVFLSNDIDGWDGRQVFVVDQRNADGSFDEHKVMLGFNDINDAEAAYMSNYEEGWQGLGAITGVSIEEFEKWLSSSHRKTKAFAEYKNVKTDEGQSTSAESGNKLVTDERYNELKERMKNNADNGNNNGAPSSRRNGGLVRGILRKGAYYDNPGLYVKAQRADRFGIVNRSGAGPLTDREVVMESDPYSKVLGKPRYYGKRQREFVARQRRRMAEKARQVAEKLNLDNVEVLESTEGLTGKKATSKGWFDPRTGKITVVVPNHGSIDDIVETVLHEAVAHYGLRKLFGENFKNFLDNVYRNVTPEIRAEITELAKKHGWDFHTATEEYLASLAENTNFEKVNPSLWSNIKSFFMKMLAKVGITLDEPLGDNELRYILWRSHQNLVNPGWFNVFGQAEDIAKQYELGVGNYQTENGKRKAESGEVAAEDEIRFREGGAPGSAREEYERKVRRPNKSGSVGATENVARRAQEAYQDSMLALKILQDAVAKETGNEVKDNENAYIAENRMSSSNKAMVEIYERDFFMPLMDEINALIKEGVEYDDIIRYLHAKHGLERNEYMRRKQAEEAARRELGEEPAMPNEGDADYEAKVNAKAAWRANLAELTESYVKKFAKRDYSGLTALTETANAKDAEAAAQQMVDEFENDHDTTPLWEAVNKATKETLRREFVGGLIDRATYDTVSTMFDFYIPLRGWDDNVAANEYEYFTNNNTPVFTPAIKTMHGRKSLSDDPIATIGYMAGSAIARANRNLMKQKFLNFVMNNPTSLATVSEQWYTMDYGTNEWVPNNPAIPEDATPEQVVEIVEVHEANMRALEKAGKATRERSGLKIGLHATKQEQQQHVVRVMRNGKEYAVYINGNPRAAQALNGMTNPDVSKSKAREAAQNVKNFMARAFTSRNPAFIISNSVRDVIWAGTAVAAKEDAEYTKQYTKNVASVLATFKLPRLLRKFRNGTLDMNNEIERYFDEFLRNGGETGFTQVLTVEDYKKNIKRFTKEAQNGTRISKKAWRGLWDGIEFLNRSAEDITRFTVYMTSRQMGRSIERSVYDAKEITVNFNKKGSGEMGAKYLNFAYIFFNATIQSLANFGKLVYRHPGKMAAALGTFSMMGFLMPVINAALMALGDDDDEENYWNLPEWVRRNNIVLFVPWTEKGFITIPLPHELRPFYGMGENAMSALLGKQTTEDAIKKSLVGFTGMLPIDFTANGGDVVVNVMPTILQPLAQVRANVTHFGTPIYKDNDFNKRYPSWTKAYKGTNSTLVAATKWLNELGGGNNVYSGGLLDWNPAVIEHLFESYLGGMGKTFNKAATTVSMLWDEDARIARNIPVASSFYQESDERTAGSQLNREYFDALEEMEGFQHRLSGYQKEITKGDAEYETLFEDLVNSDDLMRYGIIKDYSNAISELGQVLKNNGPTEEEAEEIEGVIQGLKKEMLDELEKLQAEE